MEAHQQVLRESQTNTPTNTMDDGPGAAGGGGGPLLETRRNDSAPASVLHSPKQPRPARHQFEHITAAGLPKASRSLPGSPLLKGKSSPLLSDGVYGSHSFGGRHHDAMMVGGSASAVPRL